MIDASQLSVAGVALLVAKEIWSVVKVRMSNGNGKEPAQQQVVKIEQPHDQNAQTCPEHIGMVKDIMTIQGCIQDVRRDGKDTNERITRIDGAVIELAKVTNQTQQRMGVILDHFGIAEWGKGK